FLTCVCGIDRRQDGAKADDRVEDDGILWSVGRPDCDDLRLRTCADNPVATRRTWVLNSPKERVRPVDPSTNAGRPSPLQARQGQSPLYRQREYRYRDTDCGTASASMRQMMRFDLGRVKAQSPSQALREAS